MKEKLSLIEMREIQLDLLMKFHQICMENDLCYSICGGTLLGAVRHKGYIPWDDDIDVMMPRPDYMKFVKITETMSDDRFGVRSPYQEDDPKNPYTCSYLKFVDKHTKLIERAETRKIYTNVYMDVFPIDGLPDTYSESVRLYKKAKRLIIQLALQKMSPYRMRNDKNIFSRCFWRLIYWGCSVFPQKYFFRRLDGFAQRYGFDHAHYVGDIVAGYGIKERMPKSIFDKMQLLSFEGQLFWAIEDYETYLKGLYGNYMQLPPKEKQVRVHDNIAYKC